MRSTLFLGALMGIASAHPKRHLTEDLMNVAIKRGEYVASTDLWGEWKGSNPKSKDAKEIKKLLQGKGSGISNKGYKPPALDSDECEKDKCCVWHYINAQLYGMMHDDASGECNDFARACIRMGFHDSSAWSSDLSYGGADGSLLLSTGGTEETEELERPENGGGIGLQADGLKAAYELWKPYGITMADFIQAAAKVGTLACPGGPRIRMFIGRQDDSTAAPQGLLPPFNITAEDAIDLFNAKTVSPGGLIVLLGAHTASKNHIPPLGGVEGQDLTPGKWDTLYFSETLQEEPSDGVVRFPSDDNLANSDVTRGVFEFFQDRKAAWDQAYAKEYIRMSLFGVKNIENLMECTKAMPNGEVDDEPDYPSSTSSHDGYPTSTSSHDGYPTSTSSHDGYPHSTSTKDDYPHHSTSTKDDYPHTKPHHTKPHGKPTYTTSTVYATSTITLTSCPPEVVKCPYNKDHPTVTYTVYPVSTTVCEVTPTYEPETPEETYSAKPVVPDTYTAPAAVDGNDAVVPSAAGEYPAAAETSVAPVDTGKSPVVVSGAGRTVGGVIAAAAGMVVAALM